MDMALTQIRRQNLKKWFAERSMPEREKSYFSQLINAKSPFGEKAARRIEKDYGMPELYLDKDAGDFDSATYTIPKYDISISMGNGALSPEYENVIEKMTVSAEWLHANVRFASPSMLALVTAYGDSMEPTFNDGDVLLVDRSIFDVKIDAVYVLSLNDDLYIKRLQRRPDGSVLMISDNKRYEPYTIENGERDKFSILGRVLLAWNARKL